MAAAYWESNFVLGADASRRPKPALQGNPPPVSSVASCIADPADAQQILRHIAGSPFAGAVGVLMGDLVDVCLHKPPNHRELGAISFLALRRNLWDSAVCLL